MENNLINLNLAEVLEESTAKADQLNALAVSQDNCLTLESKRTEANKEIKAYKAKIEEAKKEYLKPFTAFEKQALEAIKPYEEATKEFSSAILEAKKARRVNELRAYFFQLVGSHLDENGELPSWLPKFEEIASDIPFALPITTAKQVLKVRLEDRGDTATKNVVLKGTTSALQKVYEYAKGLGVAWDEL